MKKKLLMAVMTVVSIAVIAGCGKTEGTTAGTDTTTTDNTQTTATATEDLTKDIADVSIDEYLVKLCDYKSITVGATLGTVTDDDVDATIQNVIKASVKNEVVEGKKLESGDIANINYAGKMNGEAFEGGTDESEAGYDLEIGSNSFIPGFEDALIGMETGEVRDIDLVFPEEYYEELAGKPVTFTVTLKAIKQKVYPELNDEFAASQGLEGVSTVEELKVYVKDMLEQNVQNTYDSSVSNEIMNALVDGSEFADGIPNERYQYYYNNLYSADEALATDYGLQLEGYVMYQYGYANLDEYIAAIKSYAEKSVKLDVVVAKLLEGENQVVTDDDVEKSIEEKYADYGCLSVDDFKANYDVEEYKAYLMNLKAVDIVKGYAGL